MTEDVGKAVKRADKRLRKIMRRYGIADAVKEIGEAMQKLDDLEGVKLANAAVTADLSSGDVALAVFSVVKNDEPLNQDGSVVKNDEPLNQDGSVVKNDEPLNQDGSVAKNDELDDLLNQDEPGCESNASWVKHAKDIDRFRDKVSAYYGFSRELIMPCSISDTSDPLRESTFTVLGVEYEVSDAVLTCVGEVQ